MEAIDMKRTGLIALTTAVCLGTAASSAYAHHSHPYFYDECKSVTIEGRVEKVEFKSPHSVIVLRVDDGTAYTIDWRAPWQLTNEGVFDRAKETLVFGARVVVTGNRIRPSAQIREHFPDFKSDVDPNTVDPSAIRSLGGNFAWALPPRANPLNCDGK
jgi:hypothetical protein